MITFHASGNFAALTAIPAMPIMFFLGGTFVQRSLLRRPATQVVVSRIRRLALPAAIHVVVVSVGLVVLGHRAGRVLDAFVESIVPTNGDLGTPDSVADWLFSALWYLRDYIGLVVISPFLVRILRAWPRASIAAAAGLLVAGAASGVADATAMYLGFWTWGMSQSLPVWVAARSRRLVATCATAAALVGGVLVVWSAAPWMVPSGATLAGIGWMTGIELGHGRLDRAAEAKGCSIVIEWTMNRAVSIYLWQMVPVVTCFGLFQAGSRSLLHPLDAVWIIPMVVAVTMVLAATFAPIERYAALP